MGSESSLILFFGLGTITAEENVFYNIGRYLNTSYKIPYVTPIKQNFEYYPEKVVKSQNKGVFHLMNELSGVDQVNVFRNNRFRKIFADTIGVYAIEVSFFNDIRYLLEGNSYYEVIGSQASILMINQKQDIGSRVDYIVGHL